MMNDQLKEFVEHNREEFDQLEAPVFNLEGFKAKRNQAPEKRKNKVLFLTTNKWLVAASIVVVFGSLFFFLIRNEKPFPTGEIVRKVQKDLNEEIRQEPQIKDSEIKVPNNGTKTSYASFKGTTGAKIKYKLTDKNNLYLNLNDSTSSSNRLSAILEIERTGTMSNAVLDKLSETLNKDENSNVRLAALSLMAKYSYDAYASGLLIRSLNVQSDPMVQLELVNILGKIENININDKLYALANDPNTFSAVKDEAYNILLREDKL